MVFDPGAVAAARLGKGETGAELPAIRVNRALRELPRVLARHYLGFDHSSS